MNCIYSLADLNVGHCVELTFLKGQKISYVNILKCFKTDCISKVKEKVDSTQMRIVFRSLLDF